MSFRKNNNKLHKEPKQWDFEFLVKHQMIRSCVFPAQGFLFSKGSLIKPFNLKTQVKAAMNLKGFEVDRNKRCV